RGIFCKSAPPLSNPDFLLFVQPRSKDERRHNLDGQIKLRIYFPRGKPFSEKFWRNFWPCHKKNPISEARSCVFFSFFREFQSDKDWRASGRNGRRIPSWNAKSVRAKLNFCNRGWSSELLA